MLVDGNDDTSWKIVYYHVISGYPGGSWYIIISWHITVYQGILCRPISPYTHCVSRYNGCVSSLVTLVLGALAGQAEPEAMLHRSVRGPGDTTGENLGKILWENKTADHEYYCQFIFATEQYQLMIVVTFCNFEKKQRLQTPNVPITKLAQIWFQSPHESNSSLNF